MFNGQVEQNVQYELEIEGSTLKSGIYYCMLVQSDGNMKVIKLIFEK